MKSINIEPLEKVYVRYISRIDIRNGSIILNQGATFEVYCYSSEDELISLEIVSIDGEEYANWSDDDAYVYSLILQKLGMTERVEPEPTPVPDPEPTPDPDPTPDPGTTSDPMSSGFGESGTSGTSGNQ